MIRVNAIGRLAGGVHEKLIFGRRVKAIAKALAPLLPSGQVLDLGCGNGRIACLIKDIRVDVDFVGTDILIRPQILIPAVRYDGIQLPFKDNAFSCVTVVDALHHAPDFMLVLAEALRVSACVVVKDHFYKDRFDYSLLCGMDWLGNVAHGVNLPFNYLTRRDWIDGLSKLGVKEVFRQELVPGLYPVGIQKLLGEKLQFVAKIERLG